MQTTLFQGSTAVPPLFMLVLSTDHQSGATGKAGTMTVKLSKNGGAGAAPTATITEVDSTNLPGLYALTGAGLATDLNTPGVLTLYATCAGCDPATYIYEVVTVNPYAALGSAGAPLAYGTGTGQLSTDGAGHSNVNVADWNGVAVGASVPLPATSPAGWLDATSQQNIANTLLATVLDGNLTYKQMMVIGAAHGLESTRTWTASTHTAVVTFYRRASGSGLYDATKPLLIITTIYDSTNTEVLSQTVALSNLP
jgi:hypothetical protein